MKSKWNVYSPPSSSLTEQKQASIVKRPLSIDVICICGLIAVFLSPAIVYFETRGAAVSIWVWQTAISALIGGACLIGLWKMKRWAVYTYVTLVSVNQVVLLVMDNWNIFSLLVPSIIIFFLFKNISKMS